MTIHLFGCSHIFGNDLSDWVEHQQASKRVYLQQLAMQINPSATVLNHAEAGMSNHLIFKRIYDKALSLTDSDVVLVQWTHFDRWKSWHNDNPPNMRPGRYETDIRSCNGKFDPDRDPEFIYYYNFFLQNVCHRMNDQTNLILLTHLMLRARNVRHLFTYSVILPEERKYLDRVSLHMDPRVNFFFNDCGSIELGSKLKFRRSPNYHFYEDLHDFIIERFGKDMVDAVGFKPTTSTMST